MDSILTEMTSPMPNIIGNGLPLQRIVAGVVIGVLLLLVLGVAIAVVVFYMVRRRQAKGKNSTERADNGKVHSLGKQLFVPTTVGLVLIARI